MRLSRSLWQKVLATALMASAFVLAYQAGTMDSHGALRSRKGGDSSVPVTAGATLAFEATAYCKGETTSSGAMAQAGVAAADPALLPEGSVVSIEGVAPRYRGIYTVMDTGPMILGRHVDLYIWSCYDALAFGRIPITLTVLRLGWDPKATAPGVR